MRSPLPAFLAVATVAACSAPSAPSVDAGTDAGTTTVDALASDAASGDTASALDAEVSTLGKGAEGGFT